MCTEAVHVSLHPQQHHGSNRTTPAAAGPFSRGGELKRSYIMVGLGFPRRSWWTWPPADPPPTHTPAERRLRSTWEGTSVFIIPRIWSCLSLNGAIRVAHGSGLEPGPLREERGEESPSVVPPSSATSPRRPLPRAHLQGAAKALSDGNK